MKINELIELIELKKEKTSRATEVRSLLQKQKKLLGSKQTLTNFKEPVLFLKTGNKIKFYENATAGKFIFEHSNGQARFIELRVSDQCTMPYGDKNVRCYLADENRPYANWESPVVDSESVMLGYEKTKATDLKHQKEIEGLKIKNKKAFIWYLIGFAAAVFIIMMGWSMWVAPRQEIRAAAKAATKVAPPTAGMIIIYFKGLFKK